MFASVCVCVSDDYVSFMSEFHEVLYPDMRGWASGCGQFHIESSKLSPRRGVVYALWFEFKGGSVLVKIIAVVVVVGGGGVGAAVVVLVLVLVLPRLR